jgi:hypothetical protein
MRSLANNHQRTRGPRLGLHARAEAALVRQRLAGLAFEHVQRMRVRIAKRPQAVAAGEQQVDREHRQVRRDPPAGGLDPRADVSVAGGRLARDQREQALGVGIAFDQLQVIAEVRVERRQVLDHAVVREQPAVLAERMRVAHLERARGGEADVRKEGRRAHLARLTRERPVAEGGVRLLADVGYARGVEPAQAGAVGLAVALRGQAVGRGEQPERRPGGLAASAHAE